MTTQTTTMKLTAELTVGVYKSEDGAKWEIFSYNYRFVECALCGKTIRHGICKSKGWMVKPEMYICKEHVN